MSNGLEVKRETKLTLTLSEDYAKKLERSLLRTLAAVDHLSPDRRSALVNTGTTDSLLALRLALLNALEES